LLRRQLTVELRNLLEILDACAAPLGDGAGVRRLHPGQQLAERALAGAVETDHTHPFPRLDNEVGGT
jgi:hypothetical protein